MKGVIIEVSLPANRRQAGTMTVRDTQGTVLLANITVLGRADLSTAAKENNKTADPTKPFGHTPTGGYRVTQIFSTGDGTQYPADKYGPNGAIRLEPSSGTALVAKLNGRTGLLIHAGRDPGPGGKLVPTNGCLRVLNADVKRIIAAIVSSSDNAAQNRCDVVDVTVGVAEAAPDQGVTDGDPPPICPGTPIILP